MGQRVLFLFLLALYMGISLCRFYFIVFILYLLFSLGQVQKKMGWKHEKSYGAKNAKVGGFKIRSKRIEPEIGPKISLPLSLHIAYLFWLIVSSFKVRNSKILANAIFYRILNHSKENNKNLKLNLTSLNWIIKVDVSTKTFIKFISKFELNKF